MKKLKRKNVKYYIYVFLILLLILWFWRANDIVLKLSGIESCEEGNVRDFKQKDRVFYSVDGIVDGSPLLENTIIDGWVFVETVEDNSNREVKIIISNEKNGYVIIPECIIRGDVISAFSDKKIGINHKVGFHYDFSTLKIKNGIYNVYIYCWENEENYGLVDTGIQVKKENESFEKYIPKE